MMRYRLMAKSAAPYAPKFATGVFLAVVSLIGWQLLGTDGQYFVGVVTSYMLAYLLIGVLIGCGITAVVLTYAFVRDWKKGVL